MHHLFLHIQARKSKGQRGFTLVELMVSLALFIIVVLALIGSLYTVNDASRKVQAMRTVMDNLNFAMESISRTVRTSENIVCSGVGSFNCAIGGTGSPEIAMNSTLGERQKVEYRWNSVNKSVEKKTTNLNDAGLPTGVSTSWQAITSPEISVDHMVFYVDGADPLDKKQPGVAVQLDGVASVPNGSPIPFSIQTYLSQRTPE
jgi:prepilin-type N-terminal cleavage/methylation domain-containing protein